MTYFMANNPYVVRKGTILYHGTHEDNIPGIKESGMYASGPDVTAGTSGVWVSPSFHEAEEYSGGNVAHLIAKQDLLIHAQPSGELEHMRRANQLTNEEHEEGRQLDPDELEERGYEDVDRNKAADVSEILEKQGYHGHWDPFMAAHEMAVYNPEHLEFVGHTSPDRKFHPLNTALNKAQFNRG